MTIEAAKQSVNEIFKIILDASKDNIDLLTPMGKSLLGVLMALLFAIWMVKTILESGDLLRSVGQLTNTFIAAGIVYYMMSDYGQLFGAEGILFKGFNEITTQLRLVDPATELGSVFDQMFGAIANIMHVPEKSANNSTAAAVWNGLTNPGQMIIVLIAWLFRMAAALVVAISAMLFIGQVLMSQVMMSIGASVGPIMIPWLILPATEFIFQGWMNFMIIAGMWRVVGAILFNILKKVTEVMVPLADKLATTNDVGVELIVTAMALMFIAMVMAYLMMQVPDIARNLISGGGMGGLSRHMFSPTTSAVRAGVGAGKAIGSGAKQAGSAISNAAGKAFRTPSAIGQAIKGYGNARANKDSMRQGMRAAFEHGRADFNRERPSAASKAINKAFPMPSFTGPMPKGK